MKKTLVTPMNLKPNQNVSTGRRLYTSKSLQTVLATVFAASTATFYSPAQAQLINRMFPEASELAVLSIGVFPDIRINGKPARLAQGALIRNQDNRIVLPASIYNQEFLVVYTLDMNKEVGLVWMVRDDEVEREKERMKAKRKAEREARGS
jgi:hypothetical protein